MSLLSAGEQPRCHPQWDSLQLLQQHHRAQPAAAAAAALPRGPEGCEVTMEDLQLLHSMQEQISYGLGHVHSITCTRMDTHRDLKL